jgi:hypothetical protein
LRLLRFFAAKSSVFIAKAWTLGGAFLCRLVLFVAHGLDATHRKRRLTFDFPPRGEVAFMRFDLGGKNATPADLKTPSSA